MTELIHSQIVIIAVMMCCGIVGGLIHSTFMNFEKREEMKTAGKGLLESLYFLSLGFLYSEFSFFCENGKLSFLGLFSFLIGLWLWKKLFCGILFMGEDNEKKEEQPPGVREK